jgi:hypothetical protein
MEEFIGYLQVLVNTMGFRVFEPLVRHNDDQFQVDDCFYVKGARGANGRGKRVADGFVVFAGSEVTKDTVPSFPKWAQLIRDELIEGGVIVTKGESFVFEQDYLFSSPSSAAAVIMGRSANGLKEWKDDKGRALATVEEEELKIV